VTPAHSVGRRAVVHFGWWDRYLAATLLIGAFSVAACSAQPNPHEAGGEVKESWVDGSVSRVVFHGEMSGTDLFGSPGTFPILARNPQGEGEGTPHELAPDWLGFTYRIGEYERHVLIAKQPVMNHVSWDAIARAGAALGNGSAVELGDGAYSQDAVLTDQDGNLYRIRLPTCGRSAMADLSEWNLLIGAVHEGDMDFTGDRYGWTSDPYRDEDLKVGYGGSLTWCKERWRSGSEHRVTRGYFHVSRFHATDRSFRGERIFWRPVLELVPTGIDSGATVPSVVAEKGQLSPHRDVRFLGIVPSQELFGEGRDLTEFVPVYAGVPVEDGMPNWLHFEFDGQALLVAQKPLRHSVSWEAIAQAGAALGDASVVRGRTSGHVQSAQVTGADGHRYRVRLLRCGSSTMDLTSEWNLLIGALHEGDGDFQSNPDGRFGWTEPRLSDLDLHIGEIDGAASWCQERETIRGREHAVNRGYLTVSRFHLTETTYRGTGFGWRPVLERIDEE
jgi:hypothetical protein